MTNDPGPGFCWTCGEPFTTSAALDAHQLATGHEMDQEDHPLRQRDPTPEEIRALRARIAEGRDRRAAWAVFERHTRQAAMRAIRSTPPDDDPEPDTNHPA